MRNLLYKFGAAIFALMGLTSFNPLSDEIRLARIEGSTSFAASAPPADASKLATPAGRRGGGPPRKLDAQGKPAAKSEAEKKAPAAAKQQPQPKPAAAAQSQPAKTKTEPPPTPAVSGIFQKAFAKQSNGNFIGRPGIKFTYEDADKNQHKFRISSINVTKSGGSVADEFDWDNKPVEATQTIEVCLENISSTQAGVCVEKMCQSINSACGSVNVSIAELEKSNNGEIESLIAQAKTVLSKKRDSVLANLIEEKAKKEKCDYEQDSKVLKCARDMYDLYARDPRKRAEYAKMIKSVAMKMAKDPDSDPEEIRDLIADLDITSSEPELYKSINSAYKVARIMQPTMPIFDYQERTFRTVNIPEYYEIQMQNLYQQATDAELYGMRVDPQTFAMQLKTLNRQYKMQLTATLGQPGTDQWGVGYTDYRDILQDYVSDMPVMMGSNGGYMTSVFGDAYSELESLMMPASLQNRWLRSGGTANDFRGSDWRTSDSGLFNSASCWDRMSMTNNRCDTANAFDRLGSNQWRGRGNLANMNDWYSAAINGTTIQPHQNFGNTQWNQNSNFSSQPAPTTWGNTQTSTWNTQPTWGTQQNTGLNQPTWGNQNTNFNSNSNWRSLRN